MTVYSDIIADVLATTKRPDLQLAAAIAVRKATIKFHSSANFKKDLVVNTVTPTKISSADGRYLIDLNAPSFARIRKIDFLMNTLNSNNIFTVYTEVEVFDVFDMYKNHRVNYYHLAGNNLVFHAEVATTSVDVGYYQLPDVTDLGYNSWIATNYKDYIITEAVGHVFKQIGKDSEAQLHKAEFLDNLSMLEQTNV